MKTDNQFPLFYHAQHQNFVDDLPFWLGLVNDQGSPILELGCGSGRVLLPLAQTGCRVVGIDNDPGMLAILKSRISPELGARISLIQADITRIPLVERFALIALPCNTISTLTRQAQADMLIGVHHILGRTGKFVVSLPNPELIKQMPRQSEPEVEDTFLHPLTGEPVQLSSGWKKTADYLVVTWHYDHLLPDGGVERLTLEVHHRLDSVQDYLDAFRIAGLHVDRLYGDFNQSVYKPDSENLIIMARRVDF